MRATLSPRLQVVVLMSLRRPSRQPGARPGCIHGICRVSDAHGAGVARKASMSPSTPPWRARCCGDGGVKKLSETAPFSQLLLARLLPSLRPSPPSAPPALRGGYPTALAPGLGRRPRPTNRRSGRQGYGGDRTGPSAGSGAASFRPVGVGGSRRPGRPRRPRHAVGSPFVPRVPALRAAPSGQPFSRASHGGPGRVGSGGWARAERPARGRSKSGTPFRRRLATILATVEVVLSHCPGGWSPCCWGIGPFVSVNVDERIPSTAQFHDGR